VERDHRGVDLPDEVFEVTRRAHREEDGRIETLVKEEESRLCLFEHEPLAMLRKAGAQVAEGVGRP
jgi:hypothetical protein